MCMDRKNVFILRASKQHMRPSDATTATTHIVAHMNSFAIKLYHLMLSFCGEIMSKLFLFHVCIFNMGADKKQHKNASFWTMQAYNFPHEKASFKPYYNNSSTYQVNKKETKQLGHLFVSEIISFSYKKATKSYSYISFGDDKNVYEEVRFSVVVHEMWWWQISKLHPVSFDFRNCDWTRIHWYRHRTIEMIKKIVDFVALRKKLFFPLRRTCAISFWSKKTEKSNVVQHNSLAAVSSFAHNHTSRASLRVQRRAKVVHILSENRFVDKR